MTEVWKWIPGYEGRYEVSDLGRIRSYSRSIAYNQLNRPPEIMNPWVESRESCQYLVIGLRHPVRRLWTVRVHTLVLLAFVGERPDGMQCAHNDGNCQNNCLSNLRYATPAENIHDKVTHNTQTRGESHPTARLTDNQVRQIRSMQGTMAVKDIASAFGITPNYTTALIHNRKRLHDAGIAKEAVTH